jgi:hypothetical protein
MATVNKPLASINNGLFTLSFDYDNVSLLLLTFHVINNDTRSYTISATATGTGKNYTITIPAQTTINQNVTPGASNRLQLSVTTSGKLDGVQWSIS